MHAKVENGKLIEYPISDIRRLFPNVSLPVDLTDDKNLPDGFVYVHEMPVPKFNPITERAEMHGPMFENDRWVLKYVISALSEEEISQNISARDNEVKALRQKRYQMEADPLFFKYQRGEATHDEWLKKIQEIKDAYPLFGEE